MPDGSKTDSNSRYNGMDFQKSTTPGKMQMASILTMDPESWERTMTISIWKKTSITGTLTLQRELTLLLPEGGQPGDGGHPVSPWEHGPLVGGTVMISLFFLCFSPIYLFCSIPLLLLHSAPPPTHNPLIFLYFVNCHHALHSLALLC